MNGNSRTIVAGLLLLALLGALVWFPYDRITRQKAELETIEQRIAGLEQRISTREDLLAEVRLLERTSPLAALLLHGDTAALAGAELQGALTGIVESAGGTISQTQVLQGRDADPFVQIGARIDFIVSMTGLREILHKVESNEPVMIIDRISLATERSGTAEVGELVQASMEIAAFSQKKESLQ
ncbi:MAG: type II secretion system protein GspM [Geminicoccaceae bacterium]